MNYEFNLNTFKIKPVCFITSLRHMYSIFSGVQKLPSHFIPLYVGKCHKSCFFFHIHDHICPRWTKFGIGHLFGLTSMLCFAKFLSKTIGLDDYMCCTRWPSNQIDIRMKFTLNSHLAKSRLSRTSISVVKSLWKFAHKARQWYFHALRKISKWFDNWAISYGQTRFHEMSVQDVFWTDIL